MLDIRELLRHIQAGESDRRIARDLRITRRSVAKYRKWAAEHNLLSGTLPSPEELARLLAQAQPASSLPTPSSVEPYRAIVTDLRARGVEVATIFRPACACLCVYARRQAGRRLHDDYQYAGSYASVRRFVSSLEPHTPDVTIRIEPVCRQAGGSQAKKAK